MFLISKQEALAGHEAANLGSLMLRPFAPSGAPSALPHAPPVLPRAHTKPASASCVINPSKPKEFQQTVPTRRSPHGQRCAYPISSARSSLQLHRSTRNHLQLIQSLSCINIHNHHQARVAGTAAVPEWPNFHPSERTVICLWEQEGHLCKLCSLADLLWVNDGGFVCRHRE